MNPKMGDVGFKAGGKNYVLNMGINAMCLIEQETGLAAHELVDRLEKQPRLSDVRLMLWAGLQRHHFGLDKDAAGDIIQALRKVKGGVEAYDLVVQSLILCSPDPEPTEDANAPEDPQPEEAVGAGTGTAST